MLLANRLLSDHRNVVAFFGYLQEPNGIVLELCDGSLDSILFTENDNCTFTSGEKLLAAALDICNGCSFMHQNGIVHYDLKTANVLFQNAKDGIICKIADFGVSS